MAPFLVTCNIGVLKLELEHLTNVSWRQGVSEVLLYGPTIDHLVEVQYEVILIFIDTFDFINHLNRELSVVYLLKR